MKIQPLLERIAATIKGYVDNRVGALEMSIRAVDEQVKALPGPERGERGEKGDPGERGIDGRTPSVEELKSLIEPMIPRPLAGERGEPGERGEKGERGDKGEDGATPTVEVLKSIIEPLIPAPIAGERGERGEKGDPGARGEDGATPTEAVLRSIIEPLIPAPIAGERGERGEKGDPGARGEKGLDGKDGESVTLDQVSALMREHVATWAIDFERRATDLLQKAVDRLEKPKDGRDGRDALDLEHLFVTLGEDDRTVTFGFARGEERIERSILLAHPVYRGVHRGGTAYQKGDAVSFGGSVFIATRDTSSRPETDDSWRLAVKRGRDGKDGRDAGPPPHRTVRT